MSITELLAAREPGQPLVSLEFFPPATPKGQQSLNQAMTELALLPVSFVSVTTGAGGGAHEPTRQQVLDFQANYDFEVMAHVTCVQHSRAEIGSLLDDYAAHEVNNILALAGDLPQDASQLTADFHYASELVAETLRHEHEFSIGVAAHPEVHPRSASRRQDRQFLAEKLNQADFAITQFFFDASHYFRLVEELAALGCDKPVIPGIMPVTSPAKVKRFAELNGTRIDPQLWQQLESAEAADRVKLAVEAAYRLCAELLGFGVPGLHFYTMNQAEACVKVVRALGF